MQLVPKEIKLEREVINIQGGSLFSIALVK